MLGGASTWGRRFDWKELAMSKGYAELFRWLWLEHLERSFQLSEQYGGPVSETHATLTGVLGSRAAVVELRVRVHSLEFDGDAVSGVSVSMVGDPDAVEFVVSLDDLSGFDWGQE